MAAIVGEAGIAAIIGFLVPDTYKVVIGTPSILIFAICVSAYFCFDYRKVHKKHKPKIEVPPLSTETVEPSEVATKVRSKKTIAKAVLFFMLETFEAVFFISLIVTWQTFTINNTAVLTYQNAILIGFFILGLFLATDVIRRIRSKKAFFDEE